MRGERGDEDAYHDSNEKEYPCAGGCFEPLRKQYITLAHFIYSGQNNLALRRVLLQTTRHKHEPWLWAQRLQ